MLTPVLAQAHILDHRAAAGDVQDLHAATDAEDRQPAGDRGGGQGELELVALGLDRGQQRVRLLPVPDGIDVATGGQHHCVKPPEHRLDRLGQLGQHHRHATSRVERTLHADAAVVAEVVQAGRDSDQDEAGGGAVRGRGPAGSRPAVSPDLHQASLNIFV